MARATRLYGAPALFTWWELRRDFRTFHTDRIASIILGRYQSPIQATVRGNSAEALSYTLEDAIVMANLDLFETLPGTGLIAKFRGAITKSADLSALSEALKTALEGGGKAEFALDLLEVEDPRLLKPPAYIRNGLLWLAAQLEDKQVELGLAQVAGDIGSEGIAAPEGIAA